MTRLNRTGVLVCASFVGDSCLIVTIHSRSSRCDFSAQFSSLRHNYGLVKLILLTTATRSEIMVRLDYLLL